MHEQLGEKGYEHSDIQMKVVLMFGVGTVLMTLFAYVFCTFFMKYLLAQPAMTDYKPSPMAGENQDWSSDIRLQADPFIALDEHVDAQEHASTQYSTVSDAPQIYRIPVETAIDIVAEGGLPTFEPLPAKKQ